VSWGRRLVCSRGWWLPNMFLPATVKHSHTPHAETRRAHAWSPKTVATMGNGGLGAWCRVTCMVCLQCIAHTTRTKCEMPRCPCEMPRCPPPSMHPPPTHGGTCTNPFCRPCCRSCCRPCCTCSTRTQDGKCSTRTQDRVGTDLADMFQELLHER